VDAFVKYWPIFVAALSFVIAAVKLSMQMTALQKDVDEMKPTVRSMGGVPGRLDKLELAVERMTPRMAEVRRLRRDMDALDDDVSSVRDAMLTRGQPGPRAKRARTPPVGVPIAITEREPSDDGKD
jgi:hypothetical protein